jgi:hypothetical protein
LTNYLSRHIRHAGSSKKSAVYKQTLIRSTPDQADITITDVKESKDVFKGKTPATVTLSSKGGYFKGKTYMVEVSKEGFEKQSIQINSVMNGWYIGNLIFGGLIGFLIVDPLTGAMWTLDPKEVNLPLKGKTAEVPSGQRSLSIVLIKDIPDQLHDKLIRIK